MAAANAIDEVRQLRLQVDKLKERLDFMAPMLSLLNFTQDFFQRVECEASVQLMRLKNAKVPLSASQGGAADEKMVDTAKWLHTITDLVMSLQCTTPPEVASPPTIGARPDEADLLRQPGAVGSRSTARHAAPSASPRAPPREALVLADASAAAGPRLTQARVTAAAATAPSRGLAWDAGLDGGPAAGGPRPSVGAPSTVTPAAASSPGGPRSGKEVRFGAEVGPTAGSMAENTLEFGGLALGRGTWANAYRQASGPRREALRLLCNTGIVTERELADDLTVISEEHIEECVAIADEMLRRWPPERGPPPRGEAKAFFEERLAALYTWKAPNPFGSSR